MPANKNFTQKQRDDADIQDRIDLAVMKSDIDYIKKAVADITVTLRGDYVTREEFSPVKKVVYGLVAIILSAVGGALINLILRK